jgi:hypothetical protein
MAALVGCATEKSDHAPSAAAEPDASLQDTCHPGVGASVCHQLANAMLDPKNPHRSPSGAFSLYGAACRSGLAASCAILEAHFVAPQVLQPVALEAGRASSAEAASRQGIIRCQLRVDGSLNECQVLRSGGARDAEVLEGCKSALYAPGRFDGIPFESTVFVRFTPSGA